MKRPDLPLLSRRGILKLLGALPFGALASRMHAAPLLEPTPEIPDLDDDDPTPSQTEGPFFKVKSPKRTDLREKGLAGTSLLVAGRVLDVHGKPVKGALLDFWHCDSEGVYDNEGFKLRGHQHADENGKFRLETIFPGVYPGRTRHIHVKVQPPNGRVLTTQLYFPGEARNRNDGIFDSRLVVKMEVMEGQRRAAFDFVVRT